MRINKTFKQIFQYQQQNQLISLKLAYNFSSEIEYQQIKQQDENNKSYNRSQPNDSTRYSINKPYHKDQQNFNGKERKYEERKAPIFKIFETFERPEVVERDEIFHKYQELLKEDKYKTEEFMKIKPSIINQIKQSYQFSQIIKFIKSLSSSNKFSDKEILNTLAIKAEDLKSSFEQIDEMSQIWVTNALSSKYEFIDNQYQPIVIELVERVLKNIDKQNSLNYKLIEAGFFNLSKVCIDDYSLYDNLITNIEKYFNDLTHNQFISLVEKSINVIQKLNKSSEKYSYVYESTQLRLREFMLKPETVQRIINITIIANNPNQLNQLGSTAFQQQLTITKIASIISKQINILFKLTKSQKNKDNKETSDEDELSDQSSQSEYSLKYEQAWKYIVQYAKTNYQTLENMNFKTLLLGLVSSNAGDKELYSLLIKEFHNRIKQQSPEKIHNDFFCICLRSFYISRNSPIDIEKYEQTFSEYTKQKFKSMNTANKMTIFISYSTIGDYDMISHILNSELFTQKDLNQLNTKGKIQVFWSMCNINIFKENLFENFLLNECISNNSFHSYNPQQLVQLTQIFHIIKINQTQFWDRHKEVLNKKFEELTNLIHHHTQNIHFTSEYKKRKYGTLDLADIFNSLGIEFYFEPIVEKIFNVDFVLKGISKEKILNILNNKEQIVSKYNQLQNQKLSKVSKFDETKHQVDKEKDILLEVDGQNHFISSKKKRQSTNCKIDILEKMNYKIIQIDHFELEKLSQYSDRNLLIDHFANILKDKINFKIFVNPKQQNMTEQKTINKIEKVQNQNV